MIVTYPKKDPNDILEELKKTPKTPQNIVY
jgi:hypothetical protein